MKNLKVALETIVTIFGFILLIWVLNVLYQ